jgi:hypothetical protein
MHLYFISFVYYDKTSIFNISLALHKANQDASRNWIGLYMQAAGIKDTHTHATSATLTSFSTLSVL